MSSSSRRIPTLAAATLLLAATGCGAASSVAAPPAPATPVARSVPTRRPAAPPPSPTTRIDRLTRQARLRYVEETSGRRVHADLRLIARDPGLKRALASGSASRLRAYVDRRFSQSWYHLHVSRVRIVRGGHIVASAGVPFVVAPTQRTLRDAHGRALATLQVSIQDEIGFVRYVHRNIGVDVVVRGRGAAHVRTSLPAALHVRQLPRRGRVTIAGRRYDIRSFARQALGHEPVTVWIFAVAR